MPSLEDILNRLLGATVPLQFGELVLAGSTQTVEYKFEADGVLEGVFRIRFYTGCELDLRIFPKLVRINDSEEDIIKFRGTKQYVDGDDDKLQWNIRKRVKRGDIMRITAVNLDTVNNYDYRVDASVNYVGRIG